ncbi:hypothetical protein ACFLVY_00805 [Chloroflexota bacterium]
MARLDQKTKARIIELYLPIDGSTPLSARQIFYKLKDENARLGTQYVIPTNERPIQNFVKRIKEQQTDFAGIDQQPWSLSLSEKAGIPFEPVLLELVREWFRKRYRNGQPKEYIPFPVGVARWAVRLHKIAPYLSIEQLLHRSIRYFAIERLNIRQQVLPDSSFDDLEIAMENERDPETLEAFERLRGRVIELKGQRKQTEDGDLIVVEMLPEAAKRMTKKRKRKVRKK